MNSSRAADRTCRLCVFKEVHLTSTSFLKAILEAVYRRCVDVLLGKTVPSIYNPLRKEVQSSITTTISLHQFPAVSSGYSIFSLVKEAWPRSRWQSLCNFEDQLDRQLTASRHRRGEPRTKWTTPPPVHSRRRQKFLSARPVNNLKHAKQPRARRMGVADPCNACRDWSTPATVAVIGRPSQNVDLGL